ncbi:hypothetical protein, partial [Escherichia coli]|uniref:hypothetical protein n=1 Tax=Escherichia coli TaxID=562 RepID=UPI003D2EC20B
PTAAAGVCQRRDVGAEQVQLIDAHFLAVCGVNALSGLHSATGVGLIRRDIASDLIDCTMRHECLISNMSQQQL